MREKYVRMYEKIIRQLKKYANARKILLKGYLPISLLPPTKLQEFLKEVKMLFRFLTQSMILL